MQHATAIADDERLTVSRVARLLGIAEGTVRLWASSGTLPCTRIESGLRLFKRCDVERLRDARAAGTDAADQAVPA
jgi:excisionase family DNA binding protein